MSNSDPLAIVLFSEVFAAEALMRGRLARALPKGLELSHFMVLNHLASVGRERSPAQLAKLFNVTKGAMTNTINKLEVAGFVHIRPDWDDARRKWIGLSEAGRAARDDAVRAVGPVFDDVMTALGSDKVRAALPFLRDLRSSLD